jgi:hypothetical protein
MQTTHTPGPWKIAATGHVVTAADYSRVCRLEQLPGMDSREIDANAALIAGAPELLDALRVIENCFRRAELRHRMDAITADERAKVSAAIAKATGNTP